MLCITPKKSVEVHQTSRRAPSKKQPRPPSGFMAACWWLPLWSVIVDNMYIFNLIPFNQQCRFLSEFLPKETRRIYRKLWLDMESCRQARNFRVSSTAMSKVLMSLPRYNLIIVDFFTGHCNLNKYMHNIGSIFSKQWPSMANFSSMPVDLLVKFISRLGWLEWGLMTSKR